MHYEQVVEERSLLFDGGREGRHGARGDAADIGMVPAGCHEEKRFTLTGEQRTDGGYIRQMGTAVVRIVGNIDLPLLQVFYPGFH